MACVVAGALESNATVAKSYGLGGPARLTLRQMVERHSGAASDFRALRRVLEEFPSTGNGLARSEQQILEVLADGPRTPEQAFVAAAAKYVSRL
mgnify:CR=1 FL=1